MHGPSAALPSSSSAADRAGRLPRKVRDDADHEAEDAPCSTGKHETLEKAENRGGGDIVGWITRDDVNDREGGADHSAEDTRDDDASKDHWQTSDFARDLGQFAADWADHHTSAAPRSRPGFCDEDDGCAGMG
jgi:hypothetical protein